MFFDRRGFVTSSGAGLALAGCATVGDHRLSAGCSPLVPVNVDASQVIRTVAGLRPYRRSGFVVRAEALGSKRLVHNYGHGGSGITLSWGSAKLATELGLPGHSGPVAVLGSGVMGLSTARLVQEAGFPVTIYTAALPPDTTSNIAGGQFHPFGLFKDEDVTPEFRAQFARALDYSWRRFQIMVGDDYGIRWLPTYTSARRPDDKVIATFPPINRMLMTGEHPFPTENVLRIDTLYVETGRYLRQMIRDLQLAGGRIEVRRFATPADLAALPEALVINCTGLGSRDLFGDQELRAASSPSSSRSPRSNMLMSATATCFRGPTGSSLVAPLNSTSGTPRPSPQRSPASLPPTSVSSTVSAAPLEPACRGSNLSAA